MSKFSWNYTINFTFYFLSLSWKTSSWKGGSPKWSELKTLPPREGSGSALTWGKTCGRIPVGLCGAAPTTLSFPVSPFLPSPSFPASLPRLSLPLSLSWELSVPRKMLLMTINLPRCQEGMREPTGESERRGTKCREPQASWKWRVNCYCDTPWKPGQKDGWPLLFFPIAPCSPLKTSLSSGFLPHSRSSASIGAPWEARWELGQWPWPLVLTGSFTASQPLSDAGINVLSYWISFGWENMQMGFFLIIHHHEKSSIAVAKLGLGNLEWFSTAFGTHGLNLSSPRIHLPSPIVSSLPFYFFFILLCPLISLNYHKFTEYYFLNLLRVVFQFDALLSPNTLVGVAYD